MDISILNAQIWCTKHLGGSVNVVCNQMLSPLSFQGTKQTSLYCYLGATTNFKCGYLNDYRD